MTAQSSLIVFGASGHAKVVIDAIALEGRHGVAGIFDDNSDLWGIQCRGIRVIGGLHAAASLIRDTAVNLAVVAIGDNAVRARTAGSLVQQGYRLASVVHPAGTVADGVSVGPGTVVLAGVCINADAQIGENCIINTRASIDHDCEIGDAVHIAPGAVLCGGVRVGKRALIGAGATVIPGVTIGDHATVGAGATVVSDVPAQGTVAGTPARALSGLKKDR